VSSEQHSSSCSIDVILGPSEAQKDCSAWSAQIAIQLSDKPNTLSASAKASSLFNMLRRHLIGWDYNECFCCRQTRRKICNSIIKNAGALGGVISFNADATADQFGVMDLRGCLEDRSVFVITDKIII
jgi:hypothetical protein